MPDNGISENACLLELRYVAYSSSANAKIVYTY